MSISAPIPIPPDSPQLTNLTTTAPSSNSSSSTLPSLNASPGINTLGLPTIPVSSHEVPLSAYFRILALLESGRTHSSILNQITIGTPNGAFFDRKTMTTIVKGIAENLHIMNGGQPDTSPSPTASIASLASAASKRGSLLISSIHLKPKDRKRTSSISTVSLSHRITDVVSDSDLLAPLERKESLSTHKSRKDDLRGETLIAAQRDSVNRAMKEGWVKRKTEAALDGEFTSYLKQRDSYVPFLKGAEGKERQEQGKEEMVTVE
jgi:hypothetical protein